MGRWLISLFIAFTFISSGHAQWTQCNGPYGGNINFIAQNNVTKTLFAGSTTTGLYRYKSITGKWESLRSKFQTAEIDGIATLGNTVFVSNCIYGMFKSTDDGDTWTPVYVQTLESFYMTMLQSDGNTLVVYGDTAFVSTDGTTFTPIADTANSYGQYSADDMIVNNSRLIRAGFDFPKYVYISYSDNLGLTWNTVFVDSGLLYENISTVSIQKYSTSLYIFLNNKLYYSSTDGGITWLIDTCNNLPFCGQAFNQITESSYGLLSAGVKGVSRYSGSNWASLNNGLAIDPISFICRYKNELFLSCADNALYESPDGGSTWINQAVSGVPDYYPFEIGGMTNVNTRIVITTPYLGTDYSDDGGNTWNYWQGSDQYQCSALQTVGGRIYSEIYGGISYSDDFGASWYWAIQDGIGNASTNGCQLGPYAANAQTLLSAEFCTNGIPYMPYFLFSSVYSTDTGNTINQSSNFPNQYTTNIAVVGSRALALGQQFFAQSDNNGNNWYQDTVFNQTGYSGIYTIEPNFALLGSDSGKIFFSSDTGKTWIDITGNFPAPANQFYFLGTDIYAITPYSGIWKLDASGLGIPNNYFRDSTSDNSSNDLFLFPNPARNVLNVVLPQSSAYPDNISIKIYNTMGQQVTNTSINASSGTFSISTGNLAKGVYYLRVNGYNSNKAVKFVVD